MRNGVFRYISHNLDNVERVVAQTEPAKAMFERLRQAFPGLDAGRFFFDE